MNLPTGTVKPPGIEYCKEMVRLDWCEIQDVRNGSSNVTEKYFCSLLNFSVKAPQLRVEARW